jgi:hypothetical protein
VPLHVRVVTNVLQVDMPGTVEGPCVIGSGKTACTKVTQVATGKTGPVTVVPGTALPVGVHVIYFGCQQGPAATACTVLADRERTVCATTTAPQDQAARQQCQQLTRQPPSAQTGAKPVLIAVDIAFPGWDVTVKSSQAGSQPCFKPDNSEAPAATTGTVPPLRQCTFIARQGDKVSLTATISGHNAEAIAFSPSGIYHRGPTGKPVWFGCDEQPPAVPSAPLYPKYPELPDASDTCTLTLTTGFVVGLGSTDHADYGGSAALAIAYERISRWPVPVGVTTPPTGSSYSAPAPSAIP